MKDEQRIKVLEEEVKILKNEIKTVLLDLREQYLSLQNPFNQNTVPSAGVRVAGVSTEQKEEQVKVEEDEAEASAEANVGNAPPEIKVMESQVNASELPTMLLKDGKSSSCKYAQTEMGGTQSTDLTEIEEPLISARNDAPRLWQVAEACSEEDPDMELSPKAAAAPSKRKREQDSSVVNSKVDLVVIAGLTQWIDQTAAKLGKERTEVLVEISFAMGRLTENLKDALIRMARLSHHESANGQSISASDYLAVLAQLENLLAGSKQQDNALLSILSMMKDSSHG